MRTINFIAIFAILLLVGSPSGYAQVTTFSVVGTWMYTVPAGTTYVNVDMAGSVGGDGRYSRGGYGGRVQCQLTVTPGQILYVTVGRAGLNGVACCGFSGFTYPGGIPYGGLGTNGYAGSGGGYSAISTGTALTDRIIVAGAGGGGAYSGASAPGVTVDYDRGGDGGGILIAAESGYTNNTTAFGGGGGNTPAAAGGAPGSFLGTSTATAGGLGSGGDGDASATTSSGGGGGGGYYGGGGGSMSGGGGGSSYADPAVTTAVIETPGYVTRALTVGGRGYVVICAPPTTTGTIAGPQVCTGNTVPYTTTCLPGGFWTSSNTSVATVAGFTGMVTGVSAGTTILSYVVTLSCGVGIATTSITVNSTPPAITGGNTVCMGDALTMSDATIGGTWSSAPAGVATIDLITGVVTPVSSGAAVVTYTFNSCSVTEPITVNFTPPAPAGPAGVCVGSTATITDASPGGTWSSLITAVGSIDAAGVFTGTGTGSTIISYTLSTGCYSTTLMPVNNPPAPITGGTTAICQGDIALLFEISTGGAWSSNFPGIASVISGVVSGISGGVADIDYTIPGCPPAVYPMLVNPLPAPITGSASLCIGVAGTLADATPLGMWISHDPTIATISGTGVITSGGAAVAGMSTTITYALPTSCYTTMGVTANNPPAAIGGDDNVCQGAIDTLTNDSLGGVWTSTDISIAAAAFTTGVITGVSAGSATISYNLPNGCYAIMPFTVNPLVPAFVNITPAPTVSLCAGMVATFVATPVNGGTPTYTWRRFLTDTGTGNTLVYAPMTGDVITCEMVVHGVCATRDTVYDTVAITVYPNVTPSITISLMGVSDSVSYFGEVVTMFSTVTDGGSAPLYQWHRNGLPIAGATNSSYAAAVFHNDTFRCKVTSNAPCISSAGAIGTSNTIIIYAEFLGIDQLALGHTAFSLFPNPNNGSFTLNGNVTGGNELIYEVTNVLGQRVYAAKAMPQNGRISEQIKIGSLPAGSYQLRIHSDSENEVIHFVIQK
jgi:hypothetical protein